MKYTPYHYHTENPNKLDKFVLKCVQRMDITMAVIVTAFILIGIVMEVS
jgi:hypothetical protein